MENYAYAASYPDSGHSSPRSREIDFENTAAWDEQAPAPNYKVKFMCSYGGKIHPRSHDNQLAYVGGETKILVVDRSIKFASLIAKLSALCDADVCFKYQLPGEDLDALISVTNDDDLEHMMHEYDRLCRGSSKQARLRLFLFLVNQQPSVTPSGSFGSSEGRGERERLVEVLNSVPVQAVPPPPTVVPLPSNNVDFLFGLEKGMQQQQPAPVRLQVPDPDISGRVVPEDPIQRHIQDLKRLQIGEQEQAMNRRRSDDNLAGGFNGEYYAQQKVPEKLPPASLPANVSAPGGVYPQTVPGPEQAVYMIQGPAGVYHAPAGRVPVTGPTGQGYYAVQRMPPEVYRDQQPAYNFVTQVGAPPVTALGQPTMPPQRVAGFSEGFGMVRQTTTGGVGVVDAGYTQVAYDGMGRQVYYNAQGGAVRPPYQAVATADMRGAGTTSHQDGKVFGKVTQGSV